MGGSKGSLIAILIAVAGGLLVGVVVGLAVGWIVWPLQMTEMDVSDLKTSAQDDYIVLTASAYAYDQDLDRAESRLDLLKDPNIVRRLTLFAKLLAPDDPVSATHVASLAVALGAQDDVLYELAATPTPLPKPTAPPPTAEPATLAKPTATRAPTDMPPATTAPTAAGVTRTPTRPRPTTAPTAKPVVVAPPPGTNWIPSFPSEWPGGASYQPANVSPGQKYWHLTQAVYCDDRDTRNDCPNRPGGDIGTNIYVMIAGESGGRISAPLVVTKNDGSTATVDDIGPEKAADDPCNCNYAYLANNWPIKIGGYPSDVVSGLGLYSVRMKLPQAHTRYFLWFRLMTR